MLIYLIGMPGCGKSKCGRFLAEKLSYEYIDLDKYIEGKENFKIEEIFNKFGESHFRSLETNALKENIKDNLVISCGGGIIKKIENKEIMKNGLVIYLNTPLDLIEEHLKNSSNKRPLLKEKTLLEIYNERKDLYISFMNYQVYYNDYVDASSKIISLVNDYKKKKVLVINGPNLHLLGKRDPKFYGTLSLAEINEKIKFDNTFDFDFFQSNHEGEIIDKLSEYANYAAIIINPAAYTHTSVAIHDCLEVVSCIKVEVHLSDVDNREDFRKINFVRDCVDAHFSGKQIDSYIDAVNYIKGKLNSI